MTLHKNFLISQSTLIIMETLFALNLSVFLIFSAAVARISLVAVFDEIYGCQKFRLVAGKCEKMKNAFVAVMLIFCGVSLTLLQFFLFCCFFKTDLCNRL